MEQQDCLRSLADRALLMPRIRRPLYPVSLGLMAVANAFVMLSLLPEPQAEEIARRKMPVPALARWLLGVGNVAILAANVSQGLGHGVIGAVVAGWPAVVLADSNGLSLRVSSL